MRLSASRPARGNQSGFTLTELALVLVVFAGLVAIAVVSLNGLEDDSSARDCRTELRTIKAATEQFHAEIGFYPPTEDPLVEGEYLAIDETPNWTVVTAGEDAGPTYRAVGGRCAP